ncbi:ankyrin repeat domain-containing protein [Mitsuaria sp. GD03876]|uniref:ankyrin repeat domain-containing protein n=1 Tax=Mitsuaria sp. GD03876 TaxID=2975399 RepID=UPI00244B0E16|nr:ankyrin repeat domain-containing protein [Mitsuaria sp. GD03876]MDH0867695.1 ankyrin repeat domain-containing protein [Mitsuaria sp. GD03876]
MSRAPVRPARPLALTATVMAALAAAMLVVTPASAQGRFGTPPAAPAASDAGPPPELHVATRNDHASTVMKLLLAGVDPNVRDAQRNTALHVAIREESAKAFETLLQSPATDVNAINQAGETPLMLAAIKGRLEWAQALVKRGALVNEPGWSALHYAAAGPNEHLVRWLLAQGAEVDARSPNGTTPLMMAAGYGGLSGAEVLIAAGADASLENDHRMTAADFARRAGQDEMADKLAQLARTRAKAAARTAP